MPHITAGGKLDDLPYRPITLGDNDKITHPLRDEFQARFPPKHHGGGARTHSEKGGIWKEFVQKVDASLVVFSAPSPL